MEETVISLRNITKTYIMGAEELTVLHGVNVEIL